MMRKDTLLDMLAESPDDSFLLYAVAKEFEKEDDQQTALSYYRRLQTQNPMYVGLYFHLGKLLEAMGRNADALEAYEEGIAVAKSLGDEHAWSELAAARLELDDA